jgi:hypothetical protein
MQEQKNSTSDLLNNHKGSFITNKLVLFNALVNQVLHQKIKTSNSIKSGLKAIACFSPKIF